MKNDNNLNEKAEKIFIEILSSIDNFSQLNHKEFKELIDKYPIDNSLKPIIEKKIKYLLSIQNIFNQLKQYPNDTILPKEKSFDFEILFKLNSGAMGDVYIAKQISLNRIVVLKILKTSFIPDARSLNRFLQEAKIIAKLQHPNIVPIHSLGKIHNSFYICLEFIPGMSLNELIKSVQQIGIKNITGLMIQKVNREYVQKVLSNIKEESLKKPILLKLEQLSDIELKCNYTEFCCKIIIQIANALEYVHNLGVIHRDIKPSNIIVTPDGTSFLVDFGISFFSEVQQKELTIDFIGTIYYSSPEQISNPKKVTPSSDVYSLGATLYELITLQKPFNGNSIYEISKAIKYKDPLPLRYLNHLIPKDLECIILKSLEKNPNERYNSTKAFAEDLQNFLEYKPIKAKPYTIFTKTIKSIRKYPILSSLIFIILSFMILLSLQYLFIAAYRYYDFSNFETAEKLYKLILTISPWNTQAKLELANTLYNKGLIDEALKYFLQVKKEQPKNISARYCIAEIYQEKKELDKSIKEYIEAIKLAPHDTWLIEGIATAFVKKQSDGKEIISILEKEKISKQIILIILDKVSKTYNDYNYLEKSKEIKKEKEKFR